MTASEIGTTVLTALLGGSGAAGLLTWAVKRWAADRRLRSAAEQTRRDEARKKIDYLVEHGKRVDDALRDMAAENTLQCYCPGLLFGGNCIFRDERGGKFSAGTAACPRHLMWRGQAAGHAAAPGPLKKFIRGKKLTPGVNSNGSEGQKTTQDK